MKKEKKTVYRECLGEILLNRPQNFGISSVSLGINEF